MNQLISYLLHLATKPRINYHQGDEEIFYTTSFILRTEIVSLKPFKTVVSGEIYLSYIYLYMYIYMYIYLSIYISISIYLSIYISVYVCCWEGWGSIRWKVWGKCDLNMLLRKKRMEIDYYLIILW